jgi:hypothetical protein
MKLVGKIEWEKPRTDLRLQRRVLRTFRRMDLGLHQRSNRPERDADHSLLHSAQVKNDMIYISIYPNVYNVRRLIKHRGNFTVTKSYGKG